MERNAEGLVVALQGVLAVWLDGRERRRAEQRSAALKPISYPMVATAAEDGVTACC
jgi:hypothetical protein